YFSRRQRDLALQDLMQRFGLMQGEPVTQTIEPGTPATLPMVSGRMYQVSFEAKASQRESVSASFNDGQPSILALVDEKGTPRAGDVRTHWGDSGSITCFQIPADGVYMLMLPNALPYLDSSITLNVRLL